MKQIVQWLSFDGETFDDEGKCKAHEESISWRRLIGLTEEQVQAAISREDTELADALEQIGTAIARARRGAGELKRARRLKTDLAPQISTSPEDRREPWATDEADAEDGAKGDSALMAECAEAV